MLKSCFLTKKFSELAKATKRDEFEEYAPLVREYFGEDTAIRPIRKTANKGSANFCATIRNRLDNIPEEKKNVDSIPEIEDILPFFDGVGEHGTLRGVWYANREKFGDSWELARVWLDQALYYSLAEKYGIEHPIYVTQDLRRGQFDPQIVLGYNSPIENDLQPPDLPNEPARLPNLNWDVVWDVLTDPGFHRRVEDLTATINNARWDRELDNAVWKHTEYLNGVFSDLAFDISKGCYRLTVKKKPNPIHGIITTAVVGSAVPLLLNSFFPGSGAAAEFFQTATGIFAAGLSGGVVTTESQAFHRVRKRKLEKSNAEILRDAMEIVNYWTKPVLDADAIARARSCKLSTE